MAGRIQATTDEVVRRVVERVVSQVRGAAPATAGVARCRAEGVFATAEEAITAAAHAQKAFAQRGLSDRRAAIEGWVYDGAPGQLTVKFANRQGRHLAYLLLASPEYQLA